ncbi:MAG TPA: GreA/GreB family elongation factor, partial [Anaeromyxobacteraceae bacterium]|nr:GreA/GreB family elongation factor [Anaeromyxobacteraceae bacterium]
AVREKAGNLQRAFAAVLRAFELKPSDLKVRAELERLGAARSALASLPEAERQARADDLARRAALVEATLAALTVADPAAAPDGVAAFGTWVTVEDEDGARATWRLVGPDEADARRGLASAHAPLGRALIGHRAGEVVEVARPSGVAEVTIVEVRKVL